MWDMLICIDLHLGCSAEYLSCRQGCALVQCTIQKGHLIPAMLLQTKGLASYSSCTSFGLPDFSLPIAFLSD
jgi:hypothetical protein